MTPPTAEPSSDRMEDRDLGLFEGIAGHSLIYAFGILIARGVSFLMLPIYTRYLTPADYGVLALVEMTLDFIAIVAGAKLALGVFRFYHKAETRQEKEEIVSTSFLLVFFMYLIVGAATFVMAQPLSHLIFGSADNTVLFRIAAGNVTFSALLIVPLSLARVEDRSVFFVGMNIARLVLQVGLVLWFLVGMELGVLGVFLATLFANLLVGGSATIWLYRRVRLAWTPKAARALLGYGLPLMLTQVATFFMTFADRYYLQAVASETAVGLYNLAYQFGFLLVMIGFTPIDSVWGPKRFEIARREDPSPLLAQGFVIINLVVVSAGVGITLFVHDVLRLMATPQFHPASAVVPLIILAYTFKAWSSVVDLGILVVEKTRYVAISNFTAAGLAAIGFTVFIPRYLEWGAAGVTVAIFAVKFAMIYIFAQSLWRVRYRWRPVLLLATWGGVIVGAGFALPDLTLHWSVAARTVLFGGFVAGAWWLPVLDAEDRLVVRSILGMARSRVLTALQKESAASST